MTLRQFLTLGVALFFSWNSGPARPTPRGVVVEATRVSLNSGAVSAGATVYDGDRFATETGGVLLLRGDATVLELAEESELIVRGAAGGAQGTETELSSGTLVFSAARAAALEIVALEARIRPATATRTIGQVSVTGPKELRICARRGSLQFSYREESETIAEGAAYPVILDPPENDPKNKRPAKAGRQRKTFLLIAIGAAAAGTAAILYEHENHGHKRMESPDRP
jgi:hypothetical protein